MLCEEIPTAKPTLLFYLNPGHSCDLSHQWVTGKRPPRVVSDRQRALISQEVYQVKRIRRRYLRVDPCGNVGKLIKFSVRNE